MRAADEAAISSGTSALVLMERAGRSVARAAQRVTDGSYGRRAVVVCGKGSNGGDGFVAARYLARAGMSVSCCSIAGVEQARGAALHHLKLMQDEGIALRPFTDDRLEGCDVVVDALFGTGFRGPAEGEAASTIETVNAAPAAVVSVDIPSGVDGTTGLSEGAAVWASVTVAMGAEKLGTANSAGAARAGRVEVSDIGIPVAEASAFMVEAFDAASALPRRKPDSHKRSGGSVAVLAGSNDITGAAVLTGRGAVRMGAGYVTVGCTSAVKHALATSCPEVLTASITDEDVLGPRALDRFSEVLERADAVALGPGLGRGLSQQGLVARVLEEVELPVVADADALNALSEDPSVLKRRTAPTILTPHPAELARLLDSSVPEVSSDRLGAARAAAGEFNAVVVLKGWRSIVADPSGKAVLNPTGGPELATAGTGDVLTGATAALAATGLDDLSSAWAACFVHGLSGSVAASRLSHSGVLAWDVAESLPEASRLLHHGAEAGS
jgi:ADP-dependent NAD(P)H-hydrate dehydratase / NAD(P)H-hydrate epimerase